MHVSSAWRRRLLYVSGAEGLIRGGTEMRHATYIGSVCFLGLAISVACGDQPSNASRDGLLPADAKDVVKGPPSLGDQTLFVVERKYPAFVLSDDTLKALVSDGWKRCKSASDDWSSFLDMTSGSPMRVYQKVLHFRKADQVVMITGRYSSKAPAIVGPAVPPDSTRQTGVIVSVKGSADQLEEALKVFDAHC